MSQNGWIGVDLDGTLAHYDHWRGIEHIGAPIAKMVERVGEWLDKGYDVKVFTARVHGEDGHIARYFVKKWLLAHGLPDLEVTNVKDFSMWELWDDRAVRVKINTGEPCLPD